ncbi:hypothetical protein, partial [Klebsiella quasivariicola]|uniref:hypothetical protein n=1 Tax=Klebsiella quasivariicola TaxID=2026240 RepID=UPI001C6FCED7
IGAILTRWHKWPVLSLSMAFLWNKTPKSNLLTDVLSEAVGRGEKGRVMARAADRRCGRNLVREK